MTVRGWLCFLLTLALVVFARGATAHDPFEITTVGRVRATALSLEVTMTRKAALRLAAARGVDASDLASLASRLFVIALSERPIGAHSASVRASEEDEVVFLVEYEKLSPGKLRLEATHVADLGEGYTSALSLSEESPARSLGFHVLTAASPALDLELGAPRALTRAGPERGALAAFFRLGLEHILEGYDHLLFLAGLLIAARSLRSSLLLISAFTVSHSLTLALSAAGWVELPSVLVESIIALSIAFVGVENLWLKEEPRHRVALVFAFGLVHGLGFAGALKEATRGVESQAFLAQLLGFNLGVEAGQVGLGLALFPLLALARRHRFGGRALVAASLVIGLGGAYLLADRSLLS